MLEAGEHPQFADQSQLHFDLFDQQGQTFKLSVTLLARPRAAHHPTQDLLRAAAQLCTPCITMHVRKAGCGLLQTQRQIQRAAPDRQVLVTRHRRPRQLKIKGSSH